MKDWKAGDEQKVLCGSQDTRHLESVFQVTPHEDEQTSDIPCVEPKHSQVQTHVKGTVKSAVLLQLEALRG